MKKWLNLKISVLPYLTIEVNNTYEHYFGKFIYLVLRLDIYMNINLKYYQN